MPSTLHTRFLFSSLFLERNKLKTLYKNERIAYITLRKQRHCMGDLLVPATNSFPLQLVLSIICSFAVGIFALMQPGGSDDDDSGSGGDGGLMQPVAMGA